MSGARPAPPCGAAAQVGSKGWADATGWGVPPSAFDTYGKDAPSGIAMPGPPAAAKRGEGREEKEEKEEEGAEEAGPVTDQWVGVRVEAKPGGGGTGTGRVERLALPSNGLAGSLARAGDALFPALGRLVVLDLRANSITGPIPASVGALASLQECLLSLNRLTGPLPEALGLCDRLEVLSLGGNRLAASPLPRCLARLDHLHALDLSGNAAFVAAAKDADARAFKAREEAAQEAETREQGSHAAAERPSPGGVLALIEADRRHDLRRKGGSVVPAAAVGVGAGPDGRPLALECSSRSKVLDLLLGLGVIKAPKGHRTAAAASGGANPASPKSPGR